MFSSKQPNCQSRKSNSTTSYLSALYLLQTIMRGLLPPDKQHQAEDRALEDAEEEAEVFETEVLAMLIMYDNNTSKTMMVTHMMLAMMRTGHLRTPKYLRLRCFLLISRAQLVIVENYDYDDNDNDFFLFWVISIVVVFCSILIQRRPSLYLRNKNDNRIGDCEVGYR